MNRTHLSANTKPTNSKPTYNIKVANGNVLTLVSIFNAFSVFKLYHSFVRLCFLKDNCFKKQTVGAM